MGGSDKLRANVPRFIDIAQREKIIILTDLDNTVCAPQLLSDWLPRDTRLQQLCLRVAVKASESWVLADHEAMFNFFGKKPALLSNLPTNPDALDSPKARLLELAARYAPKEIKDDILPRQGTRASVGIGYNQQLSACIMNHWSADRASQHSDSLMRARRAIKVLIES